MHRILAILLLASIAAAQAGSATPPQAASTVPAAAKAAGTEEPNARRARELLDQAVQVLGGQTYLNALSRGEEGRWYHLHHGSSGGAAGVQYRMFSQFPDKDRLELYGRGNVLIPLPLPFSVDVIVVSKKAGKSDLVVIHNGDKGYDITNKGTSSQDKDDLKAYLRRRQHSLERVFRNWVNDANMQYFYDGMAIVDGKPTDKVTLLNNLNDAVTVFLDQSSHLPLKSSYSWRDPEDKQKNVEEEIYDNYQRVQGIMTPHSITRTYNGEPSHQRFINTARYNISLDASIFDATIDYDPMAPPAPKKK